MEAGETSQLFSAEWSPHQWYSISAIASKLGRHRKTVIYWREIGILKEGKPIQLEMVRRPCHWYARGQWLIDFFTRLNQH